MSLGAEVRLSRSSRKHIGSVDPYALKIPAPKGAEYSLTESDPSPFHAEPEHSGRWSLQPKLPNANPNLSISGLLGFSLSSSSSLVSAPSELKLSVMEIDGAPLQLTGRTTGTIHIVLKGPNRPVGQSTPLSATTAGSQLALSANFMAVFVMESVQQTFDVPAQLNAVLNIGGGQVSGSIQIPLPSTVPLLGGSTMTMTIDASPLPRAGMVPETGIAHSAEYSKSSAGGHINRVNIFSGNLNVDPVDFSLPIPGRGLSVALERYYNARGGYGWFGYGWSTFLDTTLQYCGQSGCVDGPVWGGEAQTTHRYRDASGATYFFDFAYALCGSGCRPPGLSATLTDSSTLAYDNGTILRFELPPSAKDNTVPRRLVSIEDRNGNKIRINWNATGRPYKIRDPLNRFIRLDFNTNGSVTSISPPTPQAPVFYTYDGSGGPGSNLITVTRSNVITRYGYGNYGSAPVLTSITDPNGYKTVFTYLRYDPKHPECANRIATIGYTKDQTNTSFDTYTYSSCLFSPDREPIPQSTVTDPNGHTTTYSWDPNMSTPMPDLTITDARGSQFISYDEGSFKVSSWSNALRRDTYDYDYEGRLSTSTTTSRDERDNTHGLRTEYSYKDPSYLNRDWSLNLSLYLASFLLSAITDPDRHTTAFGYDTNGNLHTIKNALGRVTTVNYNPDGTIRSVQRPNGATTLAYNYDGSGGIMTTTTDPLGRASSSTFDTVGRIQFARNAAGEVTQFRYNELGRLVDIYRANSGSELALVYDPNGNVVRVTAKNPGSTDRDTIFTYDSRNRVISKRMPDAQGSVASFQYDPVGNLVSKTLTGNTATYSYDAVNRLITLTEPGGNVVRYGSYDANDRPGTVTYQNGGIIINREWDWAGRLRRIRALPAGGSTPLVDLRYDFAFTPAGMPEAVDSPRLHFSTDTTGVTTQYSYDDIGQLVSATSGPAGGRFWTYDPNGNRSTQTLGAAGRTTVTNYSYDAADQLLNTSRPAGIGLSAETAGSPGLPATGGFVSYSYDPKGNLVSRSDGLKLAYDAANNTISAAPPGGSAVMMAYDNSDQTQRTVVQSPAQGLTTFLYDGKSIGPTSSQTASHQTYFVRTPGGGLVSMKRGGNPFYYITDRLGSVIAVTSRDSSGQAVIVNQYSYSPWGEVVSQTERADAQQPFRFAGAEYDTLLGLYKMGVRYYDATVGRFTQLDPLGGRYRYASNDPINRIDTNGLADGDVEWEVGCEAGTDGGKCGAKIKGKVNLTAAGEAIGDFLWDLFGDSGEPGPCNGPNCTGGVSGQDDTGSGGAGGNGGGGGSGGAGGSGGGTGGTGGAQG